MTLRGAWPYVSLASLTTKIGSGVTPRGGASVYVDEGVALIRSQNVHNGRFVEDGLARITDRHAEMMNGVAVESKDVLLNITGDSVARSCLATPAFLPARVNQHVAIIRTNPDKLDPHFLLYFLISPGMQALMLSLAGSGGTRKALTKAMIEAFLVPAPDVRVQRRVADHLSAYDDLIENNRRRIRLLEKAVRLLYREWFVHLRFPGHEHTKITDGVPEGWERRPVGELTSVLSRGITPQYDDEADWVVVNQKCIRDRIVNLGLARRQKKVPPPEKLVRWADVLVNSTGAGTLGRVAQFLDQAENLTVDSHVTIVRPLEDVPPHLFGLHLTSLESYLATMGRGATNQTELSRQAISEIEVLLPPRSLTDTFEAVVAPVFEQIGVLSKQSQGLLSARDLLLPRLMNGELVV